MDQTLFHPNQVDEKTLAGLAYVLGLIPALAIWMLKHQDSPSVRFHALQAAVYDGFVGIVAIGLLMLSFFVLPVLTIGAWLGTNIIADVLAPETPLVYLMLTVVLVMLTSSGLGLVVLLILSLTLIDLVAAAYLFAGNNWRYPILANWAEKLILRHVD